MRKKNTEKREERMNRGGKRNNEAKGENKLREELKVHAYFS